MRAKEFLAELAGKEKLSPDAIAAVPDAEMWPELDNSNPYHSYRFGLALAGSPDKNSMAKDGPSASKLVTVAYTEADREIIDRAGGEMRLRSQQLTTPGSTETSDVNKTSPVPQNSGKKLNRKS